MEQRADRMDPHSLPSGTYPPISETLTSKAEMRARIVELEALCAEVYEAAVVLGLPDRLLAKLWMVAAHGNHPQGFALDALLPGAPALVADVPLVHRPSAHRGNLPELPPLAERRTVMVVEDDRAMLDLIMKILSEENYDLMSAQSGADALERVERDGTVPDLLITDLMMPGMTGSELAERLRDRAPSLQVLYETGFTDQLFMARPELEPGAAFLEKPFSARGLMEAARLALFGTLNPGGMPPPSTPPLPELERLAP